MKETVWMSGLCLAFWLAATAVVGTGSAAEILAGMLGPLAAASGSWMLAERTFVRHPERLTSVMVAAFVGKVVFFGAYVAVALSVLKLRAVPFVASFTGYFVALYTTEAVCLHGLMQSRAGGPAVR